MCKVLKVSRSSYYSWLTRNPSNRSIDNQRLSDRIKEIYKQSRKTYGSPRITIKLQEEGYNVSRQRVARLMKKHNLKSIIRKKWVITTDSRHNYPVVENKLNRDFNVTRPSQVWVSDISVPRLSSGRDEGRSLATGLQELVANYRKRRKSKAYVVSVTEKVPLGIRYESESRTTVNCRSSVESAQMTSKPGSDVAPGLVWRLPAYCPDGVRRRGSVSLIQALSLNCGNLRRRFEAKGTSPQGKADSNDASSRGGAACSSVETVVMTVERRGCIIQSLNIVNRDSGRSID